MVEVWQTVFTGVCNGTGTAIGSYLATRYAIKHYETARKHIKKKIQRMRV